MGVLRFGGEEARVSYVQQRPRKPRGGDVRGSVDGKPRVIRDAFDAGHVFLVKDGGESLRVRIVAHSEGSPTGYFEAVD